MERFERLSEMSRRFGVYFRNKFSSKDSLLNDLDKKFTSFSRTPLHIASINGNVKLAKQILSVRSDLARKQDLNGFTPLHLASARTSLEMVRLLIKAYPDACKVQNKDGKTPLHVAAMKDRVEIMKLLTEEGRFEALLLNNYQNGETILHFCVKNNSSVGTLDLLVHKLVLALHTSDLCTIINSKDSDGNTVLHAAAEMRKFEIVNYLLQRDNIEIDLDAVNNKGLKALNVLSEAQRDDLELGFYVFSGDTKERTNETLSEKKDHCYQVINKKSPKKRSHKERVNVLLVVSTLIAGIAFQAMSNPPGGVWQEDSKLESGTDPVQFAYYVGLMFDSSISGSLLSYTQDHMLPNDSTSNTSTTTEWKGYSKAQENVYYFMSNLLYNTTRHSTYKGLIVEDYTSATISDYNRSDGSDKFFPYLIRYAGFPIMAYQNPFAYEIYILVNTIAFSLSLTVVFAVICGTENVFLCNPRADHISVIVWG
ncbi:hypothetical protein C5167_041110 [Papaver somniferum]|uniref:PGG domain-containing protein n=1 Tax=Papaver somniferum TaxID=3469 RepID=A0A4Y7IL40_PAPSO|nr:hypothetical protein C5167_041110 [Papaver somniferum]